MVRAFARLIDSCLSALGLFCSDVTDGVKVTLRG